MVRIREIQEFFYFPIQIFQDVLISKKFLSITSRLWTFSSQMMKRIVRYLTKPFQQPSKLDQGKDPATRKILTQSRVTTSRYPLASQRSEVAGSKQTASDVCLLKPQCAWEHGHTWGARADDSWKAVCTVCVCVYGVLCVRWQASQDRNGPNIAIESGAGR